MPGGLDLPGEEAGAEFEDPLNRGIVLRSRQDHDGAEAAYRASPGAIYLADRLTGGGTSPARGPATRSRAADHYAWSALARRRPARRGRGFR
jgi:hypothetical protein